MSYFITYSKVCPPSKMLYLTVWYCKRQMAQCVIRLLKGDQKQPIFFSHLVKVYILCIMLCFFYYFFLCFFITFFSQNKGPKRPGGAMAFALDLFRDAYMLYFGVYAKYIFWGTKFWYSLVLGWRFRFRICTTFSGQGLCSLSLF